MNDKSKEHEIQLQELLEEIAALKDLESSLDLAMTQENSRRLGYSSCPEKEKHLLDKLLINPMRYL